jgi:hypothetical protein
LKRKNERQWLEWAVAVLKKGKESFKEEEWRQCVKEAGSVLKKKKKKNLEQEELKTNGVKKE